MVVHRTEAVPEASTGGRLLPVAWPLIVYFVGYPLLWALGVANFAGPLLAIPMAAWLVTSPQPRAPRGFGVWLLFLGWMLASAIMLGGDRGPPLGFIYRAAAYLSATVFLLYAYNLPRTVTADRLADLLGAFWIIVAGFGLLALVLPPAGFTSPVELLLPGRFDSGFLRELVHPRFAQTQVFLGYPVPRPAAPFVYTNNWGSAFALLLPLFIARWLYGAAPNRRRLATPLLLLSLAPVVTSLNRGLWLSLLVALVYVAIRFARAGRVRTLQTLVLGSLLVSLVAFLSPLGGLIQDRLETPHSNDSRLTLYQEVLDRIGESPLLGFGSPQPTTAPGRNIPPVGTQGQFWMVLFSHGIIGAALFVTWFVIVFLRTRDGASGVVFWCNVTLLVALFQLPFYGMLPTQLHVVMLTAAIALRALEEPKPPVWGGDRA